MSGDPKGVIDRVFGAARALLPVIHVESTDQALRNAAIARHAGCHGVFLINHSIPSADLLDVHRVVVREFPGWWVGVNCLDLGPEEVFRRIDSDVDGVWVDNGLVDERRDEQPEADAILTARTASGWRGLYFAGTAFKYQRPVEDLQTAARLASRYSDVVTTSGPGTGQAATVEKIRSMKQALGEAPLAIASGITSGNIGEYLPIADAFLVATGISRDFTELDPALVEDLAGRVRGYGRRGSAIRPADPASDPAIGSVCFVCEWNEGRSAHLELSVRRRLRGSDRRIAVLSAGLRQGVSVNALRREFLRECGVPSVELDAHRPKVFGREHRDADLILVSELPMRADLLGRYPELEGRIMTVRGFAHGFRPGTDPLSAAEAHIEDAAGHSDGEKLALYAELEELAGVITSRLLGGPTETEG